MIESKEARQIRLLRDDAEDRGMEPLLLLCYQEWLLRTMLAELDVILDVIVCRSLEK